MLVDIVHFLRRVGSRAKGGNEMNKVLIAGRSGLPAKQTADLTPMSAMTPIRDRRAMRSLLSRNLKTRLALAMPDSRYTRQVNTGEVSQHSVDHGSIGTIQNRHEWEWTFLPRSVWASKVIRRPSTIRSEN